MSSRDARLVLLALTTGATDATAFERLGHTFASVITGNLVLLGVSAVIGDGRLALSAGVALAGYATGVLVAAPRRREGSDRQPEWPASVTVALTGALVCLVVFAIGWEFAGARPGHATQALLLALAAVAMGIQSTAVRRLGPLSTTYLTSTLTGLLEALRRGQWTEEHLRSLGILLMAFVGAAAATALIRWAWPVLPAVQLVPLALVIEASRRVARA